VPPDRPAVACRPTVNPTRQVGAGPAADTVTALASTTPASTTPASTTPASTTPASTTSGGATLGSTSQNSTADPRHR
jgi:lysine-specific demethylase PHF2